MSGDTLADICPDRTTFSSLAPCSDGSYLFSGRHNNAVSLIEAKEQHVVSSERLRASIQDLALSPDERSLATIHEDGTLALRRLPVDWQKDPNDVFSSPPVYLSAHSHSANAVRFVDGHRLVTCGGEGSVKVWTDLLGLESQTISGHGLLAVACFKTDRALLCPSLKGLHDITLSDDASQMVVDQKSLVFVRESSPDVHISCVSIFESSQLLALGTVNGTLALLESETQKPRFNIVQNDIRESRIEDVALSPDGRWLANGSRDHSLRIRSPKDGTEVHRVKTKGWCVAVEFSPDGNHLIYADSDGFIVALETGIWTETARTQVGSGVHAATCAGFTQDGRLITAHKDGRIRVWDGPSLNSIAVLKGHLNNITAITFHSDGTTMATSSYDGTVRLWNLRTNSEIGRLVQQQNAFQHCVFSPDGRRLVASTGHASDNTVEYRVWTIPEFSR